MVLLYQLTKEEVLDILQHKGFYDSSKVEERGAFESVLKIAFAIYEGNHTPETDALIEQCIYAARQNQSFILTSQKQKIPTNTVYAIFKCTFYSLNSPKKMIQAFWTNLSTFSSYREAIKEAEIWARGSICARRILIEKATKSKFKEKLSHENNLSQAIGLLCRMAGNPEWCKKAVHTLRTNRLETLSNRFLQIKTESLPTIIKMSLFITDSYLKKRNIPHKEALLQLKSALEETSASYKSISNYSEQLFGEKSIRHYFNEEEIQMLFDGDLTLEICHKQYKEQSERYSLIRPHVSELIFKRMKECALGKSCKFNCPYSECRFHTLLQLLGSHIGSYDVTCIHEDMDFERHDALLFVTNETEEEIQLVLCNTRTDRRSSIYMFDIRKSQLDDVKFLLIRYFESHYPQKRKRLLENMHRFGRPFGIMMCKMFRK